MIERSVRHLYQKQQNLLYRHSCRPCRVSDAREQESAVSLDVNPLFGCTGFSFHDFADSLSRRAQRTGCKE